MNGMLRNSHANLKLPVTQKIIRLMLVAFFNCLVVNETFGPVFVTPSYSSPHHSLLYLYSTVTSVETGACGWVINSPISPSKESCKSNLGFYNLLGLHIYNRAKLLCYCFLSRTLVFSLLLKAVGSFFKGNF